MLAKAKSMLPHGDWQPWLQKNAIAPRTARLYMRVFREQGENGNGVADLPLRDLFKVHSYSQALEAADNLADAVKCPPSPKTPVSGIGDLWRLGEHRVLCGDATSTDAVTRLLGDHKPPLIVTDPPYGVELDSAWRYRAGLHDHGHHDRALTAA